MSTHLHKTQLALAAAGMLTLILPLNFTGSDLQDLCKGHRVPSNHTSHERSPLHQQPQCSHAVEYLATQGNKRYSSPDSPQSQDRDAATNLKPSCSRGSQVGQQPQAVSPAPAAAVKPACKAPGRLRPAVQDWHALQPQLRSQGLQLRAPARPISELDKMHDWLHQEGAQACCKLLQTRSE